MNKQPNPRPRYNAFAPENQLDVLLRTAIVKYHISGTDLSRVVDLTVELKGIFKKWKK